MNDNGCLSNFHVNITASGKESLANCLRLFLDDEDTVSDYAITNKGFELHKWSDHNGKTIPLPYKMGYQPVLELVWNWLMTNENPSKFDGPRPDIDGSTSSQGVFNVKTSNDAWTGILFTIKPVWGLHHK